MIAKTLQEAEGCPVELFASDICSTDLERAQAGLYTQSEVQRGLPIALLIRHFQKHGDHRHGDMWRLTADIRRRVRWRRINLIGSLENVGRFDLILCRNVLSGMETETHGAVLASLARALAPDGYLILGQDEAVEAAGGPFEAVPGLAGAYRPDRAHAAAAA
ncbi:MAG: CheR family methyltransferase [Caulobacteraceae bacterium]